MITFREVGRFGAVKKVKYVTIISPNGGEALTSGAYHTITWQTAPTPKPVGWVRLLYSLNAGKDWKVITLLDGNPGMFYWHVPSVRKQQNKCKIRVVLLSGPKPSGKMAAIVVKLLFEAVIDRDESDALFTINPVAVAVAPPPPPVAPPPIVTPTIVTPTIVTPTVTPIVVAPVVPVAPAVAVPVPTEPVVPVTPIVAVPEVVEPVVTPTPVVQPAVEPEQYVYVPVPNYVYVSEPYIDIPVAPEPEIPVTPIVAIPMEVPGEVAPALVTAEMFPIDKVLLFAGIAGVIYMVVKGAKAPEEAIKTK